MERDTHMCGHHSINSLSDGWWPPYQAGWELWEPLVWKYVSVPKGGPTPTVLDIYGIFCGYIINVKTVTHNSQ